MMMKEPPSSAKTFKAAFKGMKYCKSVTSYYYASISSPDGCSAAPESIPAVSCHEITIHCGQVSHTPFPQSQRQCAVSSRPNEHVCDVGGNQNARRTAARARAERANWSRTRNGVDLTWLSYLTPPERAYERSCQKNQTRHGAMKGASSLNSHDPSARQRKPS